RNGRKNEKSVTPNLIEFSSYCFYEINMENKCHSNGNLASPSPLNDANPDIAAARAGELLRRILAHLPSEHIREEILEYSTRLKPLYISIEEKDVEKFGLDLRKSGKKHVMTKNRLQRRIL